MVSTTENSGGRAWLKALAVYRDPRMLAVLFMGFSSGLPFALTGATLSVWQTEAGVSLTTIGFFALVGISYNLKFVWAPLLDSMMPPGPFARLGRRRGWAVLHQLALIACIIGLGATDPAQAAWMTALMAAVVAFISASQDIVIDAFRVELLEERQQAAGSAATQYGYMLGARLISGAGALYLAEAMSWFWVYVVMASLMVIAIVAVLLTREPAIERRFVRTETRPGAGLKRLAALAILVVSGGAVFAVLRWLLGFAFTGELLRSVPAAIAGLALGCFVVLSLVRRMPAMRDVDQWFREVVVSPFADFAQRRGWAVILLFIVLYKLGDAFLGQVANPFYIILGFEKSEIASIIKLYGLAAQLVGVFLGGVVVQRLGLFRGLLVCGVLQGLSNLIYAVQASAGHDPGMLIVTISVENLSGGMGSAAFVAYLSSLCNVAFTGTQYALFSSVAALGRTLMASLSGSTAEALGWIDFFILSTVLAVPGLVVLLWMMRRPPAAAPAEAVPLVR
jgi:MFS transporter, PAT family, beta-lactamase induction signal transducer AmpG